MHGARPTTLLILLVGLLALHVQIATAIPKLSGTWTKLGDQGKESSMQTLGEQRFWPAATAGAAFFRLSDGVIICGGGDHWYLGRDPTVSSANAYTQCCLFNETLEAWTWCNATHFTPSLTQPAAWFHNATNTLWVYSGKQLNSSNNLESAQVPPLRRMFRSTLTLGSAVPLSDWEEVTASMTGNLPPASYGASSWVSPAGIFYLGGGRTGADWYPSDYSRNDIWKFNPTNFVWVNLRSDFQKIWEDTPIETSTNTPESLTNSVTVMDGNHLWQFGGYEIDISYGPDVSIWRFNTSNDKWAKMQGDPTRYGFSSFKDRGFLDAEHIPQPRRSGMMAKAQGYIWIFGGHTECGPTSEFWVYDPASFTWAIVGKGTGYWFCDATSWPGVTLNAALWSNANGSSIYMFGGSGQTAWGDQLGGAKSTLWRFDINITDEVRPSNETGLPQLVSPGIQRTKHGACDPATPEASLLCGVESTEAVTTGFIGNVDGFLANNPATHPVSHSGYLWNFGSSPKQYYLQTCGEDRVQIQLDSSNVFIASDVGINSNLDPWVNKGTAPYRKLVTLQPGATKIDLFFFNNGNGPGCQFSMLVETDLSSAIPFDSSFVSRTSQLVTPPGSAPVASPMSSPIAAPLSAPASPPESSPTTAPVAAPAIAPVVAPAQAPVSAPVASPVQAPLTAPATPPTSSPSSPSPVAPPIVAPAEAPTSSPSTANPTSPPTVAPSSLSTPSASPIAESTAPSSTPTGAPVSSTPTSLIGSAGGVQIQLFAGTNPTGSPTATFTLSTINITVSPTETPHASIPAGSPWSAKLVGSLFPSTARTKRAATPKFLRITFDDGCRFTSGQTQFDSWTVSSAPKETVLNVTLEDAGTLFSMDFFTSDGQALLRLEWSDSVAGPWQTIPASAFSSSTPIAVPIASSQAPTDSNAILPPSGPNVGGIVAGVVIAIIVVIAAIVFAVWWRRKNRKSKSNKKPETETNLKPAKRAETRQESNGGSSAESSSEEEGDNDDDDEEEEEDEEEDEEDSNSCSDAEVSRNQTVYSPAPAIVESDDDHSEEKPKSKKKNRSKKSLEESLVSNLAKEFQAHWIIDFDTIEIGEKLGSGAFGVVYSGTYNAEDVAIKQCNIAGNDAALEEFKREAILLSSLKPHPSIVQVLGIAVPENSKSVYMIMEFCEGGSLDKFIENTKLSNEVRIGMIDSIARGLVHLHRNNVVHRDLAARNILVAAGNKAKISDFGMSRIVDAFSQKNTTAAGIGPIRWMSPESLSKREYSPASDVWSFGIVCWEIWTGRVPWDEETDLLELALKIRGEGAHPALPETMPQWLQEILLACWAMAPADRPSIDTIAATIRKNKHIF